MSDTEKRDAVLAEFAYDAGIHRVWGVAGMADEILRLRAERAERILAALREPSDEALVATVQAVGSVKLFSVKNIIRAAVEAAEQEVGRE